MTTIFGLSSEEILLLQRWAYVVRLPSAPISAERPFEDILQLRYQWMAAGGKFPVTEWDVLFVKPVEAK